MTFRFIHTADWQLGKPFTNLPADLAGELQAARYSAIGRVAGIAVERGAAHVLVAGDVFDSEALSNALLRRGLERMAEHAAINWLLLPGNHDPDRPGGVWDRIQRFGLPANVSLALAPLALTPGITLLPAPLTTKNPGRDPTEWMDTATTAEGAKRIGLAHGSVQGFGSDGESSVLIARDRAARAGLSYLAMGDWHGVTRVNNETWYSGTPEPDRFPNNEPGFVLSVSISDNGAAVEKVASGQFIWAKLAASVRSSADLPSLDANIVKLAVSPSRMLLRLALDGSLSIGEHAALGEWIEKCTARLRYLDIDQTSLAVRPVAADFDVLGHDGPLLKAARVLAAAADDPAHPDHASAPLALQRLFGFAAQATLDGAS